MSSTADRATAADAPSGRRYTEPAMHMHWLTVGLVAFILPVAWVMTHLPDNAPIGSTLFALHKSLGITIWLLILARLAWRFTHPAPHEGRDMPRWQALAGRANHWLMYLVLFAMPISGYVMSAMEPYGVAFWGVPLPRLPDVKPIHDLADTGHALAQWALYALVLLHVAATVLHVAVRRDGTLQRMLPAQTHADPDAG